jgi:hypothetical protein
MSSRSNVPPVGLEDLVAVVDVHDQRPVRVSLGLVVQAVREDDDVVAGLHQSGGGAGAGRMGVALVVAQASSQIMMSNSVD